MRCAGGKLWRSSDGAKVARWATHDFYITFNAKLLDKISFIPFFGCILQTMFFLSFSNLLFFLRVIQSFLCNSCYIFCIIFIYNLILLFFYFSRFVFRGFLETFWIYLLFYTTFWKRRIQNFMKMLHYCFLLFFEMLTPDFFKKCFFSNMVFRLCCKSSTIYP